MQGAGGAEEEEEEEEEEARHREEPDRAGHHCQAWQAYPQAAAQAAGEAEPAGVSARPSTTEPVRLRGNRAAEAGVERLQGRSPPRWKRQSELSRVVLRWARAELGRRRRRRRGRGCCMAAHNTTSYSSVPYQAHFCVLMSEVEGT